MKDARIAVRYAKALISLAKDEELLDQVKDDVSMLKAIYQENRDFRNLLKSPIIKSKIKRAVLKNLFENNLSKLSMNYIDLITKKKRESILNSILESFLDLYNIEKNIIKAKLITASKVTNEVRSKILTLISGSEGNKEIQVEESINSKLIGGFILRIGDREYNASALNNLQQLKRKFVTKSYIKDF